MPETTEQEQKKEFEQSAQEDKKESYKVQGKDVLRKVKEIVHEGNVRQIIVKDKNGNVLLGLPITISAVGIILAPYLAALGAVAALLTECTITVERRTPGEQ